MTLTGTDLGAGVAAIGVDVGVLLDGAVSPLDEPPPHADSTAATAIERAADAASGYFRRIDMI
jgi:hypothetical protein